MNTCCRLYSGGRAATAVLRVTCTVGRSAGRARARARSLAHRPVDDEGFARARRINVINTSVRTCNNVHPTTGPRRRSSHDDDDRFPVGDGVHATGHHRARRPEVLPAGQRVRRAHLFADSGGTITVERKTELNGNGRTVRWTDGLKDHECNLAAAATSRTQMGALPAEDARKLVLLIQRYRTEAVPSRGGGVGSLRAIRI